MGELDVDYPDGARILLSASRPGKYRAWWADGTPHRSRVSLPADRHTDATTGN